MPRTKPTDELLADRSADPGNYQRLDLHPIYTQPDELATSTSGGGSVSFTKMGAKLSAGTTSGDISRIVSRQWWSASQADKVIAAFEYEPAEATPWTDNATIGLCHFDPTNSNNYAYDLANEEYRVGNNSIASSFSLASNDRCFLRFETDYNDETTKIIHQSRANREVVEFDAAPSPKQRIVTIDSNGAGETVNLKYAGIVYVGGANR